MEVKEFSHRDNKKVQKNYDKSIGVKRNNLKKKIIISAVAVCAFAVIGVVVYIRMNSFNIWNYIKVEYEGANGYAKAVFVVDKEGLYKDLLGKEGDDSERAFNIKMLINSIKVTTEENDIANGDKFSVKLEYNSKYEEALGIKMGKSSHTYKAEGVPKGIDIDLFKELDVKFLGVSPEATVVISNNWEDEYIATLTFSVDKDKNINHGDEITVSCNESFEEIARHGFVPFSMSGKYEADKLPSYAKTVADIDKELLKTVQSEVVTSIARETEDATFHMLFKATGDTAYLKHVNNENVSDVKVIGSYFLKKKGTEGEFNNCIYVTASANIADPEDSKVVYFIYSYNNNYITVDGKFDMNHEGDNKKYSCSTDYNKLYEEIINSKNINYDIFEIK